MKHTLITIRPTNGADLAPKDRIRLHGTLHDVINNQFHGAQPGENLRHRRARLGRLHGS